MGTRTKMMAIKMKKSKHRHIMEVEGFYPGLDGESDYGMVEVKDDLYLGLEQLVMRVVG